MSRSRVAARAIQTFSESFDAVVESVATVVQGKDDAIRLALICLVAEGHLLIEDVPGVGKTSLAKALAASLDCSWGRIQFTPDLLPSDITGVSVYNRANGGFEFRRGGIFANLVLGDEINRASPKTQSALLEAMEERQVTVDGTTYRLPPPFMVIATQNPVEHEGTYPLPESQLDRFMMRLSVGYPSRASELQILETHGADSPLMELVPVADAAEISNLIESAKKVYVAPTLKRYIVDLTEATRGHPEIYLGASPRASLYLLKASRALAASRGRDYVVPDDVQDLAIPVLGHRLLLAPEAQMRGSGIEDVLEALLGRVPIPAKSEQA